MVSSQLAVLKQIKYSDTQLQIGRLKDSKDIKKQTSLYYKEVSKQ